MQYPFDGLILFLRDNLLNADYSILRETNKNASILKREFEQLFEESRFFSCRYLATASDEKQAMYMLHALKVCLYSIEQNLSAYKNTQCTRETGKDEELAALYEFVIQKTNELTLFLSEYFTCLPEIPFPEFTLRNNGNGKNSSLQTNLSVPQLGLFIRLLVDAGILEDGNNISALINKVSFSLRTRKTQQISPESLRVKYYAPEKAAVNILKEYLSQMMQLLRKY